MLSAFQSRQHRGVGPVPPPLVWRGDSSHKICPRPGDHHHPAYTYIFWTSYCKDLNIPSNIAACLHYTSITCSEEANRIGRPETSTSEHFGLEDIARAHHTIEQFYISLEEIT
jgi:hypothetical protein